MLRFGIRESSPKVKGGAIHGRSRVYRDDYQWCPDIPDDSCILSEPRVLQNERPLEWKEYLPRVICMYGGEHGELLGKITKFTVWFMGNSTVGIEFHYGDASIILGKRDPFLHTTDRMLAELRKRRGASWHATCDLNGPGGEVITDFIVLQNPNLCHLKVRL
jgi:hypothetical protein